MDRKTKFSLTVLTAFLLLLMFAAVTRAQTCTPPRFQGWVNSCSTINLRWLNQDNSSLIQGYEIYIGTQLRGSAPGSALGFSDRVGCGFGANYTIKQIMKSGATCQTVTTGGPHSFPCSLCGASSSPPSAVNPAGGISGAPGSIISLYHEDFGVGTQAASSIPLPFSMLGLSVSIGGQSGQLFYVSPTQVNCLIPPFLSAGNVNIEVARPDSGTMNTSMPLSDSLPTLFTKPDGNAATTIERRGNQTILTLWGTGFNILFSAGQNTGTATLRLNTITHQAVFVGPAPGYVGLEQLNFVLPANQTPSVGSLVGASVMMQRTDGRSWTSNPVNVRF